MNVIINVVNVLNDKSKYIYMQTLRNSKEYKSLKRQ